MGDFLLSLLQQITSIDDMSILIRNMSHLMVIFGISIIVATVLDFSPARRYGRYAKKNKWEIPASIAWALQESAAFILCAYILLFSDCRTSVKNKVMIRMFMVHYFYRSFIYPIIRVGKPMPIDTTLAALGFCTFNGFLQGYGIICVAQYSTEHFLTVRFILGSAIFVSGLVINMQSDYFLFRLRKPEEKTRKYKIPTGGLFEYISCANYFGEITEWWGYALAANFYPATAFAIFSSIFLCTRAMAHHKFYQEMFKNYPTNRKIIIPFLF